MERLRLYIRMEESEKGQELAQKLMERYPKDSYVRVWTGKIFYDTGDEDKGLAQWEEVLSEEPDYYMAKYFAMHCLADRKEWYRAGKYVDELIKVNRRDEELLERQKEINNELVPALREALDKGAAYEELSDKELRTYLGWRLFDLEQYEDILTLLSEDSELEAAEEGLELKAWSLYRMDRYEEAIPVLEKSVAYNPENGDPYYALGRSYREVGRNEEALTALEKFVEMLPLRDRAVTARRIIQEIKAEQAAQ